MAISLVTSTSKQGTANSCVTDAIDTTGADLLVIILGHNQVTIPTISDNKSNSWTGLTQQENAGLEACRIYYSIPSSVGSGHTFTNSRNGDYSSMCVLAFSSVVQSSPFDQENGSNNNSSTIQPGSVTPSENNEVVVQGVAWNVGRSTFPPTIDGGYTQQEAANFSSGNCYASAAAYIIQTTAAATNPTWDHGNSWTNSACAATFKAAPSGAVKDLLGPGIIPFVR